MVCCLPSFSYIFKVNNIHLDRVQGMAEALLLRIFQLVNRTTSLKNVEVYSIKHGNKLRLTSI